MRYRRRLCGGGAIHTRDKHVREHSDNGARLELTKRCVPVQPSQRARQNGELFAGVVADDADFRAHFGAGRGQGNGSQGHVFDGAGVDTEKRKVVHRVLRSNSSSSRQRQQQQQASSSLITNTRMT